jgi:hypothetical protein
MLSDAASYVQFSTSSDTHNSALDDPFLLGVVTFITFWGDLTLSWDGLLVLGVKGDLTWGKKPFSILVIAAGITLASVLVLSTLT